MGGILTTQKQLKQIISENQYYKKNQNQNKTAIGSLMGTNLLMNTVNMLLGQQNKKVSFTNLQNQKKLAKLSQDVENLKKINTVFNENLLEAKKEAKIKKSAEVYAARRREHFNDYVQNLGHVVESLNQYTTEIQKKEGQYNHIVIGATSVGKSSLINYYCHTNYPKGMGVTTKEVVTKSMKINGRVINIWDTPGDNQDFEYLAIQNLAYFYSADRIFILYSISASECMQIIRVLHKIKPDNTYLIRTQCDRFDQNQLRTIEEEIQQDETAMIKEQVLLPILSISTQRAMDYRDNTKVRDLLLLEN